MLIRTNNIGIATSGTLRFNVGTSVITFSLGLALPTTGAKASNLDYYGETTFGSACTYGNATIASITMSIVRIGKQTTLYIPISVSQTNTNNNVETIGLHSITIFTDGNITIAQNSESVFTNNTSIVFVANTLSWINSNFVFI